MLLKFHIKPDSIIKNEVKVTKELIYQELGFNCNDTLLSFWQEYQHILFDNSISIYGYALAIERNDQYEVETYLEDYVLVGDDGGGQGLFIQKEDERLLLYYLDLGALGSMDLYATNHNMFEWLESHPSLGQYEDVSVDDELYEYADLSVVKLPEKKNQFLFKLRKALHIEGSITELSKKMDNLPFTIKENFYPVKYKKELVELNKLYKCLELKTKEGKIIDSL